MNRRLFLRGVATLLATPAIVRVANLMPVRAPRFLTVRGTQSIEEYIAEHVLPLARRQLVIYQFGDPLELPRGVAYTATRFARLPMPFVETKA